MQFEDETRPRVLRATETAMRAADGLFDPGLLDRIATEAGVERAVILQRWGTGPSLIADVLSEHGLASPGWPDNTKFDSASVRSVLAALAANLTAVLLNDNSLTRSALSQAITSPIVHQIWTDFVREDLEQWTDILCETQEPRAPIDRERAAQAVSLVAGQCYSRMLLGDSAPSIPNERVIDIALSWLESDGPGS